MLSNDFGVKYIGKEHVKHLHFILIFHYEKFEQDWSGKLFCGLSLDCNYKAIYINMSIPG